MLLHQLSYFVSVHELVKQIATKMEPQQGTNLVAIKLKTNKVEERERIHM